MMMDTKEQGFCYKNPNSTVSQEITQTVYQFHHLENREITTSGIIVWDKWVIPGSTPEKPQWF